MGEVVADAKPQGSADVDWVIVVDAALVGEVSDVAPRDAAAEDLVAKAAE